nr:ABC transporter permease [Acidobacteriota bacterium]
MNSGQYTIAGVMPPGSTFLKTWICGFVSAGTSPVTAAARISPRRPVFATATVLQPGWRIPVGVDGRPAPRPEDAPLAQHVTASAGYFETFRARLLGGRFLVESDTAMAEPVIVVNETLARRLFPGEQAVGKRILSTAHQIGPLGRNLMFTSREIR